MHWWYWPWHRLHLCRFCVWAFWLRGCWAAVHLSLLLHWHAQGFDRSIDELSALLTDILTTPAIKSWDDYYNNHSRV